MKRKIAAIMIALACACSARATLIDLTPRGYEVNNAPPAFFQFLQQWNQHQFDFFDSATPSGWVSLYGILNGGTYFDTSLIGHPGQSTDVSWDFSSLPGWSMSRILLEGRTIDGTAWDNIYAVPHSLREFDALETVLIHDGVNIFQISFFGRYPGSPVPETGTTAGLFALALCGLVFLSPRLKV